MRLELELLHTLPVQAINAYSVMEPDSGLWLYYTDALTGRQCNVRAPIDNSSYDALTFNGANNALTLECITAMGIKSHSGLGAYGFFVTKYSNKTIVVAPIHNTKIKYKAPTITYTKHDRKITYAISNPSDVEYVCFRIVLRDAEYAYEYITYDLETTVQAPPAGTYTLQVMGYYNPEIVSGFTEPVVVTVSDAESSFPVIPDVIPDAIAAALAAMQVAMDTKYDDTLATKIDNVSVNGDKIIFNANDTKVSEVDNGAIFVDKEW